MMRHRRLIWAGIWRNGPRTTYTVLSIMIAFVLFGLLQGVTAAFGSAVARANLDRLYVESRFGLSKNLPIAALEKIQKVAGVKLVSYATWFGGSYQDLKQQIFTLAVDPRRHFAMYPELNLPAAELEKFANTRDGAVVNKKISDRFHWKIGDRVPVLSSIWNQTTDGTSAWTFEIVGIFRPDSTERVRSELLINHAYFDEERAFGNGTVGWFVARIDDPARSAELSEAIDSEFSNSGNETLTQNEQEKAEALLKQLGDFNVIVNLIIGAVFFTMLLLTGNTMMQSVRERIPEFAVLKTLGYSTGIIASIIFCEAMFICVLAALLGLFMAWLLFPILQVLTDAPRMPLQVIVSGVLIAGVLATVTMLPSTIHLLRINVVDALAGR
jgi:putative ABC transport system permease protein